MKSAITSDQWIKEDGLNLTSNEHYGPIPLVVDSFDDFGPILQAFTMAFSIIIISELGDKTFIISAIMAMENSRTLVFIAAGGALVFMTILSGLMGVAVTIVPRLYTHYGSMILFICFGLKMFYEAYNINPESNESEFDEVKRSLREDQIKKSATFPSDTAPKLDVVDLNNNFEIIEKETTVKPKKAWFREAGPLMVQVFSMIFLAEWGDRSQISTVMLAARDNMIGVLSGALAGHLVCTGLAVMAGRLVADIISVRTSPMMKFIFCAEPIPSLLIFSLLFHITSSQNSRIVDFKDNFIDLIKTRTDKNWLIKFYAPWCHACQRLEPIYHKVAEKIYHSHDHLIVGRVDCTKYHHVCEAFDVESYPTVVFINKGLKVPYNGDRSVESITEFAERLNGPDINKLNDCEIEKPAQEYHQYVLSTYRNKSDIRHLSFINLAKGLKQYFRFYHLELKCQIIKPDKFYMVKKHLNTPLELDLEDGSKEPEREIYRWLERESFPVYGQINRHNYEKALKTGKTIFLSILERYEPARKFTSVSAKFHRQVANLIESTLVKEHPELLYAYTTDIDLVRWIYIGDISVPNVMILKSDKRYRLLNNNDTSSSFDGQSNEVPKILSDSYIKTLVETSLNDDKFEGGNSYYNEAKRSIYKNLTYFIQMFKSNPLLCSVLLLFPTIAMSLVIYMTWCSDGQVTDDDYDDNDRDEDDDSDGESNRTNRVNHIKQD